MQEYPISTVFLLSILWSLCPTGKYLSKRFKNCLPKFIVIALLNEGLYQIIFFFLSTEETGRNKETSLLDPLLRFLIYLQVFQQPFTQSTLGQQMQ